MSYRDYAAWAAQQYGVDPGIIDGIARFESNYRPNAFNNWDSNAQRGTPSRGIMQFIQPTFNAYARQAQAANPNAWQKFGGKLDWTNPQQQMLAASWAVKNGHGSAWATYDRAKQYAQNGYNYQPRFQGGPQGGGQAVDPAQLADIKQAYGEAIGLVEQQRRGAIAQRAKFDQLTDEQKAVLRHKASFRETAGMDIRQRAAMQRQRSAAYEEFDQARDMADNRVNATSSEVARLRKEQDQTINRLAEMQLPPANSEMGGAADSSIRQALVATARQEVGTVAAQAMKYIRAAGGTGYEPWCGSFVQWIFKANGMTPPPARSVPTLLSWAQQNNRLRQTGRAGDLVMFDWNHDGTPDHVELVAGGRGPGRYQAIGGNTSGNLSGSQVAQKLRADSILGFVDAISPGRR